MVNRKADPGPCIGACHFRVIRGSEMLWGASASGTSRLLGILFDLDIPQDLLIIHDLGKGEVESSILSGSTSILEQSPDGLTQHDR